MPQIAQFTVIGEALSQGSMKTSVRMVRDKVTGSRRPVTSTRHSNPHLVDWRTDIGAAIQQQCVGIMFDREVPVRVRIVFFVYRPKSLPKRQRTPVTGRDLDKLARAACDAMTKKLYADDAQVTELHVRKRYAAVGTQPRAVFYVTEDPAVDVEAPATWPDMPRLF
jgi:Holliday junction resolvase RusA-like endonuclease